MTTQVRVLIEGNKACVIKVLGDDGNESISHPARQVVPGCFVVFGIYGDQKITIKEIGEFLS